MLFALLLIFSFVEIISTEKKSNTKQVFLAVANVTEEDTKVLNFQIHSRNTIPLFS
jgi:hypothetical protein